MDAATYFLGNLAFWAALIGAVMQFLTAYHMWTGKTSNFDERVVARLGSGMSWAASAYLTYKILGGII